VDEIGKGLSMMDDKASPTFSSFHSVLRFAYRGCLNAATTVRYSSRDTRYYVVTCLYAFRTTVEEMDTMEVERLLGWWER
jgi:hypothetical protein